MVRSMHNMTWDVIKRVKRHFSFQYFFNWVVPFDAIVIAQGQEIKTSDKRGEVSNLETGRICDIMFNSLSQISLVPFPFKLISCLI